MKATVLVHQGLWLWMLFAQTSNTFLGGGEGVATNAAPINTVPKGAVPVEEEPAQPPVAAPPAPAAVSAATPVAAAHGAKAEHQIGVGDKLNYRVVEDQEEAKILTVSASGEIEVPYLGPAKVLEQTVQQAREKITRLLVEKELYKAGKATVVLSVEEMAPPKAPDTLLLGMKPKKITVVGQVRAQGAQEMPLGEALMLSQAILKAGGFGSFADSKHVVVVRKGADGKAQKFEANLDKVFKDGELDKDMELKPDDMVIVKERWWNL